MGEKVFRVWWESCHPFDTLESVTLAVDKTGIDGRITRAYQVKYDEIAHTTGNVFVETVSNDTTGAPGWALKCEASVIYYVIAGMGMVIEIDPLRLKRMVPALQDRFRPQPVQNKGYKTIGLIVPIDDFQRIGNTFSSYAIFADFRSRGRLGRRSA
jgi:hypothetical protein